MPLFRQERRWAGIRAAARAGLGRRGVRSGDRDPSVLPVWTPFWSIGYHRDLLRLVRTEIAAMGLRHSFDGTGSVSITVTDRPAPLDLRALAQHSASRPLREWPELVREEVTRHVTAAHSAARFCAQAPPVADTGALLAIQMTADTTPAAGRRVLASGLAVDLVYDLPAGVAAVPEHHLASWGTQVESAFDTALDNTRLRVRGVLGSGRERHGHYDVVAHHSPFTASTTTCMDELAGPITPYGVLFGVPSLRELVAHVVTDPDAAADALRDLPVGLRRRYDRAAAPLSPRLYYWRSGQVAALPPGTNPVALTGDPQLFAGIPHS